MGRPTFLPAFPETTPLTLQVWAMELDEGGYDAGGAYWGRRPEGVRIYWAESLESVALEASCMPDQGTVEMSCDAKSFKEAWQKFVKRCPLAVLCPSHWEQCTGRELLKALGKGPKAEKAMPWEGYVRSFRYVSLPEIPADPAVYIWQETVYTTPETLRETQ